VTDTRIGVAIALAASASYSGAVAMQAYEARQMAVRHLLRLSLIQRLATRPLWVAGACTGMLGWGLQMVAHGHAPLTLVEPVLATALVMLLVIGITVLRERVSRREVLATLLVVSGVVGVALTAPTHTASHLHGALLGLSIGVLASVVVAPHLIGPTRTPGALIAVSAGVAYGVVALLTKFASDDLASHKWSSLIVWVLLVVAFGCLGLLSEMSAFRSSAVTQVAPTVFGLNVFVPVALAPTLAGETWIGSPFHVAAIAASLAAVVAGVVTLGRSQALGAALQNQTRVTPRR
jgi:drug/metabolite transporter (DMT)-like permease